jgi:hypothetical protein
MTRRKRAPKNSEDKKGNGNAGIYEQEPSENKNKEFNSKRPNAFREVPYCSSLNRPPAVDITIVALYVHEPVVLFSINTSCHISSVMY